MELWKKAARKEHAKAAPVSTQAGKGGMSHAWTFDEWTRSLNFHAELAKCIAEHVCPDSKLDEGFMLTFLRKMPHSLEVIEELLAQCGAVGVLARCLMQGGKDLAEAGAASGMELNSKFLQDADNFELSYSSVTDYYGGLEKLNGSPDPKLFEAMESEHTKMKDSCMSFTTGNYGITTDPQTEWAFVTGAQMPAGCWPGETKNCLPEHRREAKPHDWLQQKMREINATLLKANETQLLEEEVLGLRLYTGPMFERYNRRLRAVAHKRKRDRLKAELDEIPNKAGTVSRRKMAERQGKLERLQKLEDGMQRFKDQWDNENAYTTTIQVINSGLIKLGKVQKAMKVFRGISGGILPPEFWVENEWGVCGGVENAFLSTTVDRDVAMSYAASDPKKAGTVFEVQMSMVDRGANLQWISQYPHEAELCFPPLTGLQVLSTRVEKSVLIVEARLNVNLVSLTIEEVVAKRYKMVKQLCDELCDEVEVTAMKADCDWKPVSDALFPTDDTKSALWQNCVKHLGQAVRERMSEEITKQDPKGMNNNEAFVEAVRHALSIKREMERPVPASIVSFLHPAIAELGPAHKHILELALQNVAAWPVLEQLKLLDISGSAVLDDSVKVLAKVCPNLREANISGCKGITDQAAEYLVENCLALCNVSLEGCTGMTEKGTTRLFQHCLQQSGLVRHACVTMKEVRALRNALVQMGDASAASDREFAPTIRHLAKASPDLEQIDLTGCQYLDPVVKELADGCPKLRRVQFSRAEFCGCDLEDQGLKYLAEGCHNLQQVDLTNCKRLTDQSMKYLAEGCHDLQQVVLSRCEKLTDQGVRYLVRGCRNLQYIDLTNCEQLTDLSLKYVAAKCPNLQQLTFWRSRADRESKVTREGVKFLAEGCPKLQQVTLPVDVTDEDVKYLGERCPDLQQVAFNGGHKLVTRDAIRYLAEYCQNLRQVRCPPRVMRDEDVKHLAERCPNLQAVGLASSYLTDQGVKYLAENCPHLEQVDLSWIDNMKDQGLKWLAEGCPKLQQVGLIGCYKLTDQGIKCFADGCPNLQNIELGVHWSYCASLTDLDVKYLAEACPKLQVVKFQRCNNLTDESAKYLANSCPNLTEVVFDSCFNRNRTDEGQKYLRDKIPGIKIRW